MTFQTAMQRLEAMGRFGSPGAVQRVARILQEFNNPQNQLQFIHVAGTNGKGSVCTMLSNVLRQAGYKTGLFISPYITEFCERIQINGEQIPKQTFADLTEQVLPYVERLRQAGEHMSEFELITVVAMLWFCRQNCRAVILEAGIGGKRDCTNVIENTLVSVLTSISMDHMQLLGDSIEQITMEKCGIMKENGVTVCAPNQKSQALTVIEREANLHKNTLIQASLQSVAVQNSDLSGTDFLYHGDTLHLPLIGAHQILNVCTALAALEQLQQQGFCITLTHIKTGLAAVRFPARWELLQEEPQLFIDGAHNRDGIDALKAAVTQYFTDRRVVAVIGAMQDKDADYMAQALSGVFEQVITMPLQSSRALHAGVFAAKFSAQGQNVVAAGSVGEALRLATAAAGENGVILVCGSLFAAAQVRAQLKPHFLEK